MLNMLNQNCLERRNYTDCTLRSVKLRQFREMLNITSFIKQKKPKTREMLNMLNQNCSKRKQVLSTGLTTREMLNMLNMLNVSRTIGHIAPFSWKRATIFNISRALRPLDKKTRGAPLTFPAF